MSAKKKRKVEEGERRGRTLQEKVSEKPSCDNRTKYNYPQGGEETRDGDQGKRAQAGGTVSWHIVAAATANAADAFAAAGTTTSHEYGHD